MKQWVRRGVITGGTLAFFALCALSPLRAEENAPAQQDQGEKTAPAGEPAAAPVPAQEQRAEKLISRVDVRGNQIVNTNTIVNKLRSRPGTPLIQETVNDDIKRLYGTGFFQDIKMEVAEEPDGFYVTVVVEEKPVVKQLVIEGAKLFPPDKLRKEVNVIEGQILDPKLVKDGVNAIKQKYVNKGFKFVDVKSDINVNDSTREAFIRITINEGQKYKIKAVKLEGVKSLKYRKVRKQIKTGKFLWVFKGVFKEDKFKEDLDRLRGFFQDNGFLDVNITPEFLYDDKEREMTIVIHVEEGNRYVTGEVKIEGNLLFPQSEIWQVLSMLPGTTFSQRYLIDNVEAIRKYYFERGYIDARILPETNLNRDTGKVDVLYKITEGDLFFVEKVKIRGNTKTKDIVIRREIRIKPGEKFDGAKLDRSKQRLQNLGYFEDVAYDSEPGTAPNKRDVVFRVKEKQTGELSFGAGISSIEQFVGFAEIAQRNFDLFNFPRFTGGGQSVSLRGRLGSLSRDFDFNFVEPYIFNKPISFGLNLYDTSRFKNNTDFEEKRLGFSPTISKAFGDFVRSGFGYALERVKLDELSDDAPAIVRQSEGNTWLSRLRWFISRDTRDNVFNPAKGSLVSFSSELVGSVLGGQEDFYIVQGSASKYYSFRKDHVIEGRIRLGTADAFGNSDTVPVFDRFYAGGLGTIRGFNARRVGPKEAGDAIGGQSLGIVNLEYTWPILENYFKGAVFVDAGQVDEDSYRISSQDFAFSTGPGLKVNTPLGPIALYYGFPLSGRDTKNKNGKFEFSFSRAF